MIYKKYPQTLYKDFGCLYKRLSALLSVQAYAEYVYFTSHHNISEN